MVLEMVTPTIMGVTEEINDYIASSQSIIQSLNISIISRAIDLICNAYYSDSTIYIIGNGGSATTAEHLSCDFNKGLSHNMDRKFNMVCLNDNIATMMAYANDCGYDNIFLYQLQNRLKNGDILLCISGSGNSINVIKAAEYAKKNGNVVITMTGYMGGKLIEISDCPIHVPVNDYRKAEDCHLLIGHLMAQVIENRIKVKSNGDI